MYLNEQYSMYKLAYHLTANHHFYVLHINEKAEEIWLEKYENKKSIVIRLLHRGFDWKNHLKKDIAQVFQRTKAMKRVLTAKHIEIHNVYVSNYPPVDDWESLKKPMQLKEKNPLKMKVYYLSYNDRSEETARLLKEVDASDLPQEKEQEDMVDKEKKVDEYKHYLKSEVDRKQRETEEVFSYGKPFYTYILLITNMIIFFIMEAAGNSQSVETLIEFGAKYNPAIIEGEWWRIISSMFLHIGFLHLFMNMLAVYYLGSIVERIFGSGRFMFIYFLAGIGGGLASFAFSMNVSAGASGALFGLFGTLLYFGINYKQIFLQTMGRGVLLVIIINIVFGFTIPQIDNAAHLGGLVFGFIASAIVHLPKKQKWKQQGIALVIYMVMIASLIGYGIQNNVSNQGYYLMLMEETLLENDYEEVIELGTKALEMNGDMEVAILFQRAYAYIELGEYEFAIEDLEQNVTYQEEESGAPEMPEAYYNLALLYYQMDRLEEAGEIIEQAYVLDPENEDFIQLYEQITGEPPK
ncbi:rhomboid family intramembrane serine protease [Virgibacillus kimchii]